MANQTDIEDNVYYIPDNITQQSRIFGMRKRNLIEAGIAMFTAASLINLVPFVLRVQVIVTVVVLAELAILFINGIHGRSVTEWLIAYINFKNFQKVLHYRDIRKSKRAASISQTGERLSYAERMVASIKSKTTDEHGHNAVKDAVDTIVGRLK